MRKDMTDLSKKQIWQIGRFKMITYVLFAIFLVGCSSGFLAPIRGQQQYAVKRGDSLSVIAQRFNVTTAQLMSANSIRNANRIQVGQVLNIPGRSGNQSVTTRSSKTSWWSSRSQSETVASRSRTPDKVVNKTVAAPKDANVKDSSVSKISWMKPTQGNIVRTFNPNIPGHKGIQIEGTAGQKVVAASNGRVEYAGSGNPGYGKLIIIKHANNIYSAYGYLLDINAVEGRTVQKGTTIASMGLSPDKREILHFEIRSNGKPVNPMLYIK